MDNVEWSKDDAKRIAAVVRAAERPRRLHEPPGGGITPYTGTRSVLIRITSQSPTGGLYPGVLATYSGDTDTYADQSPAINCWVKFVQGGNPLTGDHYPALYTGLHTSDSVGVFIAEAETLCISETNGPPTDVPPVGCRKRSDPTTLIEYTYVPGVGWVGYCPCVIPVSGSTQGSAASGTIQTTCCANLLSFTLCMTVVPTGTAPACVGGSFVITYSAIQGGWYLSLPAGAPCSAAMTYLYQCVGGVFSLTVTCNGQLALTLNGVLTCEPLYWHSSSGGGGPGYITCFTAQGGISVTITECSSGGGGGGGGGGIVTNCCPSNPVPQTLVARFSGGTGALASLNGATKTLTFFGAGSWQTSGVSFGCQSNNQWGGSVSSAGDTAVNSNMPTTCNPFSSSGTLTDGSGDSVTMTVTPT